jgi:hypothetical protein
MTEPVRYEIEVCALDEKGTVVLHDKARAPYGFHFINKVYPCGGKLTIATVFCDRSLEDVREIAKILAKGLPIDLVEYQV